jgi:hypothetical protein
MPPADTVLFLRRLLGTECAKNTDDKMSFAQKEWPGGRRILIAGISTANAVSPKQKLLSGGVALATPTDVGQPLQSRIVAKPRLFAASYPRR